MSNPEENKSDTSIDSTLSQLEGKWQGKFNFKKENNDLKIFPINPKEITDEIVEEMSRDASLQLKDQQLKSLNQLVVSLESCEHVTDEGIKQLAYNLGPKIDNVKKLSWSFLWGKKLTDGGIKTFLAAITPYTKDLEQLTLNLSGCEKISDEGLRQISEEFKNFKGLQDLQLDFNGCNLITDKGLGQLGSNLSQSLKDLKKLNLVFRGCEKISGQGLKTLGTTIIDHLKSLENFTLNVGNCDQIEIEAIDALKETLKGNSKLHSEVLL